MFWWMRTIAMLRACAAALILAGLLPALAFAQDDIPSSEPPVQDDGQAPLPPDIPPNEDFGEPPGMDLPPVLPRPGETPPTVLDPGAKPPAQVPKNEQFPKTEGKAGLPKLQVPEPDPEQDRDAMLAELYSHLAKAPDAEQSTPIAKTIETLWLRSGSETIGLLMRRALKAVEEQRMDLALKLLDAVVDLAPDYAEGFSRRAYVHYLKNDYTAAVGDLRRTLALEPNHYTALEGLGRILRENGQKKSALKVYQELLRIYPYMPGAKEAVDELTVEVEGQGI
jgi:tetratricopeptide (TPR) repeat protein